MSANCQDVTIVIPAYNAEQYISQTLESVITQTYKSWMLIVVDDCSSDGTCDVVNRYSKKDGRIQLHTLKSNNGAPAIPRNIGVALSSSEWIAFLDADDVWHPQKLEYQMRVLHESQADFCSTRMKNFESLEEIDCSLVDEIDVSWVSFSQQLRKNRVPTSSVVVRRELMVNHPFNEDARYKAREDMACWLHVHEDIEKSVKIETPLLFYRVVQGQISGDKGKMLKKTFMVLNEYRKKGGDSLGVLKYYYFFTYIFFSFYYRVLKRTL